MKLYELQENLMNIDNIIETNTDPETMEILESARQQVLAEIDGKMENICEYLAELKNKIEYYKSEEKRIASKRKTLENRSEWLKNLMFGQMKATNQTKAEYGTYTLSIAKTPDKVIVDDEMWLPDTMCTITRTPNKTAIKEAMVDGKLIVTVDGHETQLAHTESGETIRIK